MRLQIATWIAIAALAAAACSSKKGIDWNNHSSPTDGGAAGDGGDVSGPHVRIISPESGDTLTGGANMEMDLVLPAQVASVEFAIDGHWIPVKLASSSVPLDASGAENGAHTLGYRVTAEDGTVYEDSVKIKVDNPDHHLDNYTLGSSIYSNGETVSIDLSYSESGLELTVDGSALDSEFDAGAVEIEDLGDGAYRVTYPISEGNSRADGRHLIVVSAENADGQTITDYVEVDFRGKPNIPFVVEGGSFIDRGSPPVWIVSEGAPELVSVESNPTLVTGGSVDMKLKWEEDPEHPAAGIIIASEDNSGYWTVPVSATEGEQTLKLSLPALKPSADGTTNNLTVTVVGNEGRAISWQTYPITELIVGSGGVQISLTWDTSMDLDLHVTDPNGKLADFASIGQGDGLLDLDSNAECEIDHINTENVYWADGREAPGTYKIYVAPYAACEQANVHFKVAAQVCGRVSTYEGDFTAADANDDPNALGRLVGQVVMDCPQKVSGKITFERRNTIEEPDTRTALKSTGTFVPARFVPVQAIRTADKTCLARTLTDKDGNYTLRFQNTGDPKFTVKAEARWGKLKPATASNPCPDFETLASVMMLDDDTVYYVYSSEQDGSSKPTITGLDLKATMAKTSGAFNLNDVVAQGYNWVRAQLFEELPKLNVRWSLGKDTPKHTSYYDRASTLYLLGKTDDPDQWDDVVIGHELSHFIVGKLSHDDTPGGPHSGRSVPTLAWSEGLATALAANMLGRDAYIDTIIDSGWISCSACRELEGDFRIIAGTERNKMDGKLDEFVVTSILFDMLDGSSETDKDPLNASFYHLQGSVFTYLKNGRDRGYDGIDLVDYLDGWRCQDQKFLEIEGVSYEEQLKTLLNNPDIDFKYDFARLSCPSAD